MTFNITMAIASAVALTLQALASAAPLNVSVESVQARGGTFYISVQTKAQFTQDDGVAGTVIEGPEAGKLDFSFDLPAGDHAATVWHDDNGNGTFDTGGERGAPLDGWTMPNALALRAATTFDEVKFSLGEDGAELTWPIHYER